MNPNHFQIQCLSCPKLYILKINEMHKWRISHFISKCKTMYHVSQVFVKFRRARINSSRANGLPCKVKWDIFDPTDKYPNRSLHKSTENHKKHYKQNISKPIIQVLPWFMKCWINPFFRVDEARTKRIKCAAIQLCQYSL